MPTMRAKVRVYSVETPGENYQTVKMTPVCESPFDKDGNSEDNTFAKWTPSGDITLSITNPNLLGKLKVDQRYYVDFTEAPGV